MTARNQINWGTHSPIFRTLYMTDGEPNLADPMAWVVFVEIAGTGQNCWVGWRCRLIRWLINRWMPTPTVWQVK